MGYHSPLMHVSDSLDRNAVSERFAAWLNKYLDDHYAGDHTKFALKTWGRTPSGTVRNASGIRAWRRANDPTLPGPTTIPQLLKQASKDYKKKISIEDTILHKLTYKEPTNIRRSKKKSNGAQEPVFTISEGVPSPAIEVHQSEYDGHHRVTIEAHLPLHGVLALMAMLDDAQQ